MSDFTFDGVEAGEGTFEDLPEGTYVAMIEKAEVGESNDHPTLRCQFRVVQGDHKNRVISDWLHFTQKAAGVVLGKIQAAGVEPPTGLSGAEAYALKLKHLLVPKHVEIVVRLEEYPKGSGTFNTKVKGWKKAPVDLQETASVGSASAPTDDDIPFMWRDTFDATAI